MKSASDISVVVLAGGVGGAKMAEGFAGLQGVNLTVIGNIADDEEFHGLWVSPDIDTMIYTLSGKVNQDQGWGVVDEGTRALNCLQELGQDTWMTLGDRDLGLHIFRTMHLKNGVSRQTITDEICKAFKVDAQILLPTENVVQTRVRTADGWLSFQEYFVRERCAPDVQELIYEGISSARPNQRALDAIQAADLIVIAPSNPLVSIAPIMKIGGMRDAVANANGAKVAVSPLVGGKAIKGPAEGMMKSLGMAATQAEIAAQYAGLVDALFIDISDQGETQSVMAEGVQPISAEIVMRSHEDKVELARQILCVADLGYVAGGQNA